VRFTDEPAGRNWSATGLHLDIRLPANLAASALGFGPLLMRARFNGAPLVASGVAIALQANRIDFTNSGSRLSVPEWQLQWNEAKFSGELDATLGDQIKAAGRLGVQAPSLRQLLQSISIPAPATRDAKVLGPVEVITRFEIDEGALVLSELNARLDATRISGSLNVPTLAPLSMRFELSADEIDMDRYRAPENAPSEPFEFPLSALKSLDAKGTLKIRRAVLAGAAARELRIDVD
jgi:AsmA protein